MEVQVCYVCKCVHVCMYVNVIGKRPQHKPKLRWRDCIAKDLHSFQPDPK